MTFDEYDTQAQRTMRYLGKGKLRGLVYTVLAASGEAGEMCDVVKKMLSRGANALNPAEHDHLREEIGDVLWYLNAAAGEMGTTLEAIARENIEKLEARRLVMETAAPPTSPIQLPLPLEKPELCP